MLQPLTFSLLTLLLMIPLWGAKQAHAQSTPYAYGLYGLFPTGSTRILGMGGAATAISDDASAVAFNPAGMALARWSVDVSSGTNRILNKEADLTGDDRKEGVPYNFNFTAGAIKVGSLAVGAGVGAPYDLVFDFNNFGGVGEESIRLKTVDFALAYRFSRGLALGVTVHQETATIIYKNTTLDLEDEVQMLYPTIGIMTKPKSGLGFGITFSPERRYDIDESNNTALGGFNWYRDIVIPAKVSLGMAIRKSAKLTWAFDVDIIQPVERAIFVGGDEAFADSIIAEKQQTVIHGGYEYHIIKQKDLDFIWRGGGYAEPARLESAEQRLHFTMGVEVRFGIITVAASYDQAEDFSSTAQSISLAFGAL